MSDRGQTASGLRSVAVNYGTLPRAPRRTLPPSGTSSLPRPRTGPATLPGLQNVYATHGPPYHSISTSSTNGHHPEVHLPSRVNGGAAEHSRVSWDTVQPRRLDVPPETDWRHDVAFRVGQSRCAPRQQPLQQTNRGPYRAAQLCSLCLQLPVEPSCPYCPSCRAHVARIRLSSKR